MGMPQTGVKRRIAGFLTAVLMLLVFLAGRIAWVQLVQGKNLSERSETQLKESRGLLSPRGTIFDRNGRELAVSNLAKSLYANPSEIKDPDEVAALLAPLVGMEAADIKERVTGGGHFIWLKRTLEPETAERVADLIKEHNLKGLAFIEESKRYYPNDNLAAQVLGFVGTDDIGLDGLEMALDGTIKGQLSEQVLETDSRGIPILESIFSFGTPKQGKNVYLTLDSTIQFIVENSLDKAMASSHAAGATVIVMNPRTGDVLAMANRPTYNPNQFYRYGAEQWKNRAVANIYEPGSTFKSIVAATALQEGLVSPTEKFVDNGYVIVSGRRIQNWSGDAYGTITFTDIIKESINTGFVQVGMRVGASRLTNYARNFGFGQLTNIELPGEVEGLLFKPEDMRDSDLATMSIGQSIAVTPIQLITAVSAIANDGVLLKPHIIKEIRNADGSVYSASSTQAVRQVISLDTARLLTGLLEKVVSEGGGKGAAVKGYRIAGKTGTAQKLREGGGGYYSGRYIASFVGFAPAEDPQLAVLVVLDDPQGSSYYGGQIAAPVAGEIFAQVLRYLDIAPNTSMIPLMPKQPVQQPSQPKPPSAQTYGKVIVPDLKGKTMREASDILNKLGLSMVPSGSGVAVGQSIPANTLIDSGTEVSVYFGER